MSAPKEMEFSDHPIGGNAGELSGDIGGEIFIPLDSQDEIERRDDGTLDEPVTTTLVSYLHFCST